MGCRLWGCTELDTTEATKQQQHVSIGIKKTRVLILIELITATVMNFDQGKSMVEVYPSVSVGISLGKATHTSILAWRTPWTV